MREFTKYKSNGIVESVKQTGFELGALAIVVLAIAGVLILISKFI